MQRDGELRKEAVRNITSHPAKYIKNWSANIGRMLFAFPYSYTPQKLTTYFYMLPNMFLTVLFVLCIYPAFKRRRAIPYEIYALLLFGFISLGGSSLISAGQRQFTLLVPVFAFWIIYVLMRTVKIELRSA